MGLTDGPGGMAALYALNPYIAMGDIASGGGVRKTLTPAKPPKLAAPPEVATSNIASALRKRLLAVTAAQGAANRGGTIRTSPLGLLGEPVVANKTLLGA